jgi:hypothetical protein
MKQKNEVISKELKAYREFNEKYGNVDCYDTLEIAREYVDLKTKWWGSNLVVLGIEEKGGKFYPMFNVFD